MLGLKLNHVSKGSTGNKIGYVTLEAIAGTNILVPYLSVKSRQLIWRSGTRRWNLRVHVLPMSCTSLTIWQGTRIKNNFDILLLEYQLKRGGCWMVISTEWSVNGQHFGYCLRVELVFGEHWYRLVGTKSLYKPVTALRRIYGVTRLRKGWYFNDQLCNIDLRSSAGA